MIRISKSTPRFKVVVFVRGQHASAGRYRYEESQALFGDSMLASNLIEYSDEQELTAFCSSAEFASLLDELKGIDSGKPTFLEIEITDSNDEIWKFDFSPRHIRRDVVESVCGYLSEKCGVDGVINEVPDPRSESFHKLNIESHHLRISLPQNFIQRRKVMKSAQYRKVFADRYFDSQIPFVFLVPTLNGSADGVRNTDFSEFDEF